MRWATEHEAELERLWEIKPPLGKSEIARRMTAFTGQQISRNAIVGKSRTLGLHHNAGEPMLLAPSHPAARDGRTVYPRRVVADPSGHWVLKPGQNSTKLGGWIEKGPLRGMPIVSLTLEERATCPRSCANWLSCYGNHMGHAIRYQHGPALVQHLDQELAYLTSLHRERGLMVRLHVLGDFYHIDYVETWKRWLDRYRGLHVFGYTGWEPSTRIGRALDKLSDRRWDRFAVRFSNADVPERGATTIRYKPTTPMVNEGIVCPVQTGKTKTCGTCGLCWNTRKNIAFAMH